jgi:ubiquinone/menaquinone biosynthesis C-methylase UbiE
MMQAVNHFPGGLAMRSHRLSGRYGVLGAMCLILCCTFVSAEDRNDWQQPDRVMSDLGMKPGTRVADIGCGEGYFTFPLAGAVGRQGHVFALDIDAGTLASLKKQADQQRLTNVTVVVSEAVDTRLPSECVDAVLVCDVLHEVPEAQRLPLLQSAVRALKPGGFLYLIDYRKSRDVKFDPYEKLIPRDELIRICSDAGLRLDAEFHYLKYQVFLRFQKVTK